MSKVLIIDDENDIRCILSELLSSKGFTTVDAPDGRLGIEVFKKESPDAVLLDYSMPGMGGFETLLGLRSIDPSVPIIFLTAYSEVHVAVEAIKAGAYDFITKPPDMDALVLVLKKAIERLELEREVQRLKTAVGASIEGTLGRSGSIKKVISEVVKVAASDFSIIIQGETGTGKSTVAELIHNASRRAGRPFVRVDIGTIPESLLESELFGCEKGAFTGAERARAGYFEAANGGTLFLDELENMSPAAQSKLLSAVEQKKVYRLGAQKPTQVDVRLITASNCDLRQLVKEKKFREDLFFRLNEFIITLPPLRERKEDISFLTQRFLNEACAELNRGATGVSGLTLDILLGYGWSGNVRELKNVIRRAALVSSGQELKPEHIDFLTIQSEIAESGAIMPLKELSAIAVRDAERAAIRQALSISSGNKSRAAAILQVDYKTLLTKIKLLNIG